MVKETSLSSITIGWSAPPPELQDRVHQYKVMATHLNESLGPIYLPKTANSYDFENLTSKSSYMIQVAACSQYKTQCGDWSILRDIWTLSPEEENPDTVWWIIRVIVAVVALIIIIICTCRLVNWAKVQARSWAPRFRIVPTSGARYPLRPTEELKVGDPAELLTYDDKWEFPRKQLILGESIGSGRFGDVRRAEARFICKYEAITIVAVKSIMDTKDPFQAKIIDCEIKILAHLGKHLNVVSLLGACNANTSSAHKPLMIMEFCRFGNLCEYLRNRKACFINQIDTVTGKIAAGTSRMNYVAAKSSSVDRMNCGISSVTEDTCTHSIDATHKSLTLPSDEGAFNHQKDNGDENDDPIYTRDLLCWAWQVAHGMKYLGTKGILHGDLAARNVLLADDKVVKICDFGLSKILHVDKDAEDKRQEFMHILWSSVESVRDQILSVQSDIWSYGVVLWEFFSLGETPYDGKELKTVYRELVYGFRLEKPEYATQDIYEMMLHCWASEPRERPTFNEIAKCIGNSLDESVKTHYINLSALGVQPYVDALEYGERDLSSIRPPEQRFGGTDFQLGTDALEHDRSEDYRDESQSYEISGHFNVLVDNDAPEHDSSEDYLAESQLDDVIGTIGSL